jgi:hypothetical protein
MMTIKTLACAAALSLASLAAHAAGDHSHAHEHKPQHGGIVAEASDIDFELVASAEQITLYVRDHGKPASTAGAVAKLTLLSGADKRELALSPAGDNKLEAKGAFKAGPGTKAVATVTLAGKKPVNVRFSLK